MKWEECKLSPLDVEAEPLFFGKLETTADTGGQAGEHSVLSGRFQMRTRDRIDSDEIVELGGGGAAGEGRRGSLLQALPGSKCRQPQRRQLRHGKGRRSDREGVS